MQTGIELLIDEIELPSRGTPYTQAGLIEGSRVKIRPFVLGDQRELTAAAKHGDSSQVYQKLLSRLIVEPKSLDVTQLLMSDLMTILFAVRIKSFGNMIDVGFDCDFCGSPNQTQFDCSSLMVRDIEDVEAFAADGLELKLPVSGKTLTIHLPRLRDERAAVQMIRDMQNRNQCKDMLTDRAFMRRAVLIDEIDGDPQPPLRKFNALMDLPIEDYDALKDFLVRRDIGLDLESATVVCTACQESNQVSVAMTPEFFRPAARRAEGS